MRLSVKSYDDVIENIKRIISEKGLKQIFVAEKVGMTSSEFSNILNDRRKLLRIEHLKPIADALGVDLNTLFDMNDKHPTK